MSQSETMDEALINAAHSWNYDYDDLWFARGAADRWRRDHTGTKKTGSTKMVSISDIEVGDTVRVTLAGKVAKIHYADGDFHLEDGSNFIMDRLDNVEVIEKANDPKTDPVGTIRRWMGQDKWYIKVAATDYKHWVDDEGLYCTNSGMRGSIVVGDISAFTK